MVMHGFKPHQSIAIGEARCDSYDFGGDLLQMNIPLEEARVEIRVIYILYI